MGTYVKLREEVWKSKTEFRLLFYMSNDLFRLNLKEFHQRILPLGGKRLISPEFQRIVQTKKMASEAFSDHHWCSCTLVSWEAIHVRPSISGCELYRSVRLLSWWPIWPQLSWTLSLEPFFYGFFHLQKAFLGRHFLSCVTMDILRMHCQIWLLLTWTGSVEIKLVANPKWSTIESEYLLSGSLGTLRNRVTGYGIAINFRQRKISSKANRPGSSSGIYFVKCRSSLVALRSFGRRSVAYRLSSHS